MSHFIAFCLRSSADFHLLRFLDGVHSVGYTRWSTLGWSTLGGLHLVKYTRWSTLIGVHSVEYTRVTLRRRRTGQGADKRSVLSMSSLCNVFASQYPSLLMSPPLNTLPSQFSSPSMSFSLNALPFQTLISLFLNIFLSLLLSFFSNLNIFFSQC